MFMKKISNIYIYISECTHTHTHNTQTQTHTHTHTYIYIYIYIYIMNTLVDPVVRGLNGPVKDVNDWTAVKTC